MKCQKCKKRKIMNKEFFVRETTARTVWQNQCSICSQGKQYRSIYLGK